MGFMGEDKEKIGKNNLHNMNRLREDKTMTKMKQGIRELKIDFQEVLMECLLDY